MCPHQLGDWLAVINVIRPVGLVVVAYPSPRQRPVALTTHGSCPIFHTEQLIGESGYARVPQRRESNS